MLGNLVFKNLSVLISNAVNVYRYNSHRQKIFGVIRNFKSIKGVLGGKNLRTVSVIEILVLVLWSCTYMVGGMDYFRKHQQSSGWEEPA